MYLNKYIVIVMLPLALKINSHTLYMTLGVLRTVNSKYLYLIKVEIYVVLLWFFFQVEACCV